MNTSLSDIAQVMRENNSFLLLSHVRPDGDAIGSQLALGHALEQIGKKVFYVNEHGVPENLSFLPYSENLNTPTGEQLEVDVVIALDCATKPRLGENALKMAEKGKLWINIDHHISNPGYGDINHIDATSPATGQIVYHLLLEGGFPISDVSRDNIYVAVSTDTGSFQYGSTTSATYKMAADLVDRGLEVGKINRLTYDNYPYRRIALIRSLLNSLERTEDGKIASWKLLGRVKDEVGFKAGDSEDLIDMIRAIQGVEVAASFEEVDGGAIRVSLRSKNKEINVCDIAKQFGGGGHAMAAGISIEAPVDEARAMVVGAIQKVVDSLA